MKKVFILIIFGISTTLLFTQGEDWVARYNGSGNGMDQAYAMALDSAGNIYVTGRSHNGTSFDYVTVKYNADGVQQWVAIYDIAGNSDDDATDICVDASGNVYITGFCYDGTKNNCATIKYNSAGIDQWIRIYEQGRGFAIDVDSSGNVYIGGDIYSEATHYDYLTIKYDSNGNQLWDRMYGVHEGKRDSVHDITVDSSGNVYVTGGSWGGDDTGHDFATIKYDSSGVELRVARFSSTDYGQWEWADDIALDSIGNVYVIGSYKETDWSDAYATVKYDNDLNYQWEGIYRSGFVYNDSSDIVVDSSGNVYVTGTIHNGAADIALVKYNTGGGEEWISFYDGPENKKDWSGHIALGPDGSVYVTGRSERDNYDYITIKYDISGNKEWDVSYNGPGNDNDWGWDIAVDSSGYVYVTGWSTGDGTDLDICTIKYSHPLEIMQAEAIKEAISNLSDDAFSKPAENRREKLMEWMDDVIEQIREKNYKKAIKRLENILKRMDGYFGGNPNNDWIISQAAQEDIYPIVASLIESLEELL